MGTGSSARSARRLSCGLFSFQAWGATIRWCFLALFRAQGGPRAGPGRSGRAAGDPGTLLQGLRSGAGAPRSATFGYFSLFFLCGAGKRRGSPGWGSPGWGTPRGPPCSRPRLSRWQSYGLFYPPAVPAFSHQVALRHGRLRGPEPDVWVPVPSRTVTPSPSYGFLCALQYRGAATRPRCHVCPGPVTHGGGPHGQSPEFPMKVPLLFLGPFGTP